MEEAMREMSFEELGSVCSNLAKACSKQMRMEEADLFGKLASYYGQKRERREGQSFKALSALIEEDLSQGYAKATGTAQAEQDRGAQRSLVWGEKATKLLKSLLARYEKQGTSLLEKTNVFVCDICGFVYVGEQPPEICPVCKVPSFKILAVQKEAI